MQPKVLAPSESVVQLGMSEKRGDKFQTVKNIGNKENKVI